MAQKSTFLSLPLEIKSLIYAFCYSRDELNDILMCYDNDSDAVYPGCTDLSHQGLYYSCRELRRDLFPIFAQNHIIDLSHVFTNRKRAIRQPSVYQLHGLEHIRLQWPVDVMSRSTYATYTRSYDYIGPEVDVYQDMRHLSMALLTPNDHSRVRTLELAVSLPSMTSTLAFSQYRKLFRSVVEFVEAFCAARKLRFVFVQPRWPEKQDERLRVRLWQVSQLAFGAIRDNLLVLMRDCDDCRRLPLPIEAHCHGPKWLDEDEVLAAVAGKRVKVLDCPKVSNQKNWKVIFTPGGSWKYWNFAMQEMQRIRQQ